MFSRLWIIGLGLSVVFAPGAYALDIAWSTGSRDIVVQAASRCTLLVRAEGAGEQLPSEWRLVWAASADSAEPLVFLTAADAPTSGVTDVCALAAAPPLERWLARVDTVVHCNLDGVGRASVARYVLQIAAGTLGKIKLLPASLDSVAAALGLQLDQFPEVTINGGCDSPYPPVLETAQQTRVGRDVQLTSTGAFLGNVRSVTLADRMATGRVSFEVLSQSETRLTARAVAPGALPGGYVAVTDSNGLSTAIPAAPMPASPLEIPTDHFLVRFRPGATEPPQGQTKGEAAVFQYRSTALQDSLTTAGVTNLERILPWFDHSDVHSTNLLGEPVVLEDLADLYVAHVPPETDIQSLVGRLSAWPDVCYASCDWPIIPNTTLPNDPYFPQQWAVRNSGQDLCGFVGNSLFNTHIADVWDRTRGKQSEGIAILDTGIDGYHPDFDGRVVLDTSFATSNSSGYDDDDERHGTAVAGIALATGHNSTGIAGVAWQGTPWAIKVFDHTPGFPYVSYTSWIIRAVDRCRVKGIPIVNMSFSTPIGVATTDSVLALNDICLNAFLSGELLVASSGNAVSDADGEHVGVAYPAAYAKRVYAVGAMLPDGARWLDQDITPDYCQQNSDPFLPDDIKCQSSNYGPWLDVIAPGGRLIVTTKRAGGPDDYYTLAGCDPLDPFSMGFGGTSAAAPLVSGVASLLRAAVPNLAGEDLEQAMDRTAYPGGFSQQRGWGLVRADGAMNFVVPPQQVVHQVIAQGEVSTGSVAVVDSAYVGREFLNVPGMPTRDYQTTCWRYTVRATDAETLAFHETPRVWARASGTQGWLDANPYDYAEQVPAAQFISLGGGESGPSFLTNVYKVFADNDPNQFIGWYPCPPREVRVAYTAVGIPSSLVGVEDGRPSLKFTVSTVPNPAKTTIWLDIALPTSGLLRADIVDVAGRRAATVADGEFEAGPSRVQWDGRRQDGTRCQPGIYWCRVGFEGRVATRKFVLLGGQP